MRKVQNRETRCVTGNSGAAGAILTKPGTTVDCGA
jgi:hypothetical protein